MYFIFILIFVIIFFIFLQYRYRNIRFSTFDPILVSYRFSSYKLSDIHEDLPINVTLSYKEFRRYHCQRLTNSKVIPKYIFRMSRFPFNDLPNEIKNVLDDTLKMAPGYTQIYLDNTEFDMFLYEWYPEYLPIVKSLRPGAYQSDIIRLLLLYHYGGVYNDMGHTYLTPISYFILETDEFILVKDIYISLSGIYNAFIATFKKNPIIKKMIKYIINNVKNKIYGYYIYDITGPTAIKNALHSLQINYDKMGNQLIKKFNITLKLMTLHSRFFYATCIINDNKDIINLKFNNYYQTMYDNKSSFRYPELWFTRMVYY